VFLGDLTMCDILLTAIFAMVLIVLWQSRE
jgi:hypothetical protein